MTYNTAREAAEAFAKARPTFTSYPDDAEIELTDKDISEILNGGKTLWETETGDAMFTNIQDALRDSLEYDVKEWCDSQHDVDFDELEIYPEDIAEEAWELYCEGKIESNDEIQIIEQSPSVNLVVFMHEDNSQGTLDRSEESVRELQEELSFDIPFDTLYEAVQNTPSEFREIWMIVAVPLKDFDTHWSTVTVQNPTMYIGNSLMGGYMDFDVEGTFTVNREDVLASIGWKNEYDSNEAKVN